MSPLYVSEDEHGDLSLSGEEICRGSTSPVILDDPRLWDAYCDACRMMHKAAQAVRAALRVPAQPVTPETLTMEKIAQVRQWAQANGRRGLHADAVRCEGDDAPLGAMRRICAHLNRGSSEPCLP